MTGLASRLDGLGLSLIRTIVAEAPADALSLAIGQMEAPVPEPLREALDHAASRLDGRYGPNAGQASFRETVGAAFGVEPARVIATTGVQQALALAMLGLVNPGDDVLVPDPGFPTYASLARIAGARPVPYVATAETGFRPTAAAVAAAWTPATRAIVVASPANPTGAVFEATEWEATLQLAADRGAWVLSDEIYRAFADALHPSALHAPGPAVVASGLSKAAAIAGWRVGWLIVPEAVAPGLIALQQNLVTCAPSLTQEAALGAFTPAGMAATRALAAEVAARRETMIRRLHSAGWQVGGSDGGLFVWTRWPGVSDDLAFARFLANEGRVIVVPGSGFGAAGRGWVRLSCGSAHVEEGVSRLVAAAPRFRESLGGTA